MPVFDHKCPECGCVYEVIEAPALKASWVNGFPDDEIMRCPNCQAEHDESSRFIGTPTWEDTGHDPREQRTFPRKDMGLGTTVRDKAHERWLMDHHPNGRKRAYKLRKAEAGEHTLEELHADQARADEQADRELADWQREMQAQPGYAEAMRYAAEHRERMTREQQARSREIAEERAARAKFHRDRR